MYHIKFKYPSRRKCTKENIHSPKRSSLHPQILGNDLQALEMSTLTGMFLSAWRHWVSRHPNSKIQGKDWTQLDSLRLGLATSKRPMWQTITILCDKLLLYYTKTYGIHLKCIFIKTFHYLSQYLWNIVTLLCIIKHLLINLFFGTTDWTQGLHIEPHNEPFFSI